MVDLIIQHLASILSLSGVVMIALISPGPNLALTIKNSLIYSRKTALFTTLGISIGTIVHIIYSLLGVGLIISKNLWLLLCIKYLGACYLLYIGYKGLKTKNTSLSIKNAEAKKDISSAAAIRIGILTSIINPKSVLFFISLFSVIISPYTPLLIMIIYGIIIYVLTFGWFSLVAIVLSRKKTREKLIHIEHWIERVAGGAFALIGIKLLFMRIN